MPLTMQRITLYLTKEEAPDVALTLGSCGVFEPGQADDEESLPEALGKSYRETFLSGVNRFEKINAHLGVTVPSSTPAPDRIAPQGELEQLNDWLGQLWRSCSQREEQLRRIHEKLGDVRQLIEMLSALEPLDIDLGLLQGGFRFLNVRVGIVPAADVGRVREAVGLLGYTLYEFSRSDSSVHILLAGLTKNGDELDRVLSAASFTEFRIPPEFGDHPSKVRRDLMARRDALMHEQQAHQQAKAAALKAHTDRLNDVGAVLALASAYARMSGMLRRRGGLVRITGWMPKNRAGELQQMLHKNLGNRFALEIRDPLPEESLKVPSALRHPALLRPFATLVRTYGVPRYGEVDPTWLFAISFIAMFGMMFGDVGHGLVIAATGLIARRRLFGFAPFVIFIGASSTLFGFVYGSLFGYEELIHPLWKSPMSDPVLMFRLALNWGIAFIVIMTAITIFNRLREGAIGEALLSGGGLAGAAFYFGIIFAGARWLGNGTLAAPELAAMAVPLSVIMGYEWRRIRGPIGEKVIVVFIEGFETLLGYIVNTLSFLRVAAFSLNHVALAVAVITLANMVGPAGHWLVVVLGNLFILILEGAIVTIQVLRLEYYEGFSRFFRGDGREFRPLTLRLNTMGLNTAGLNTAESSRSPGT